MTEREKKAEELGCKLPETCGFLGWRCWFKTKCTEEQLGMGVVTLNPVEITSGTPAAEESVEYMTKSECEDWAKTHTTYTWKSADYNIGTWSDRPKGCVLSSVNDGSRVFYNTIPNTPMNCGAGDWKCIQKSPTDN